MKKTLFYSVLLICLLTGKADGQDPHFSQYFSSPLTLNPAMAGYYKEDYRVSANFRQQWWSVGAPFVTSTISYDSKIMQNRIREKDILAVGGMILYDQSLSGGFESVNISLAGAYHKALDAEGIQNIGAGFQFNYAYRGINYASMDFATQFNGNGFDTHLPSYENFSSLNKNYVDLNAGMLYTYKEEKTEFYVGGSVYHLLRPNTSFLKGENFRLPMRFTVHAGSRFRSEQNGNELFIGGIFMEQAGATDKSIGLAYGINVNEETTVYAGSWYRFSDALVPYAGLTYKRFNLGLTYDVITSSLRKANRRNSSFELSANLLISRPRNVYTNYKGGRIF